MNDFLDLKGASGARYRFRHWPEGAAQMPAAGNYAYVRQERSGPAVVWVGETNDLSKARSDWPEGIRQGATHVFTRLNVARAVRIAEHEDLAAHYTPAQTQPAADS